MSNYTGRTILSSERLIDSILKTYKEWQYTDTYRYRKGKSVTEFIQKIKTIYHSLSIGY